jgi:poly-gamma-glutamate synthesis protein (capsule biosynthesis protein)
MLAEYQRPLGQALIDHGADVIYGHHSHELHPIEVYRDRPIFFSLGNFLFENPHPFMGPESLIARVSFGDRVQWDLAPLRIDDRGVPRLAEGPEGETVMEKIQSLSSAGDNE